MNQKKKQKKKQPTNQPKKKTKTPPTKQQKGIYIYIYLPAASLPVLCLDVSGCLANGESMIV